MAHLPTLRQLSYLVELSERLNFRIAAEAQLVTQSTLSAGIKELETVLGVQLVDRDKRHVRLTAVGGEGVARAPPALAAAPRGPPRSGSPGRCAWAPSPRSRPTCCRACSRPCGEPTPS